MNYIREINAFERRMKRRPLPTTAQLLWYKLMHVANTLHWIEWFSIDNERILALLDVSGEKTLRSVRRVLEDEGYIVFHKGAKGRPSRYKLNPVTAMEQAEGQSDRDDNDLPPEEPAADGFLAEEVEDITQYFGYTETLGLELKKITQQLYETYLPAEKPTEQDERRVFQYIRESHEIEGGQWSMSYPQEKKELLAYAFEVASAAGAINWNYIAGIYRNFASRGIKTREQVYEYEFERDRRKGRF